MLRRLLPTAALVALLVAACRGAASPTPALSARDIITKGMEATANLKTVHLAVTASGTLDVPQLGSAGLNLKGTTLDGDIDIAGKKVALHFLVPPLLNVEGDVVVADEAVYFKTTLTGPKWMKESAGDLGGASPSAVPDPKAAIDELGAFLNKDGVNARTLDDAACGDRSCYQVELTIPSELLADAGSAAPLPSGVLGQDLVLNLKFDKEKLYLTSVATSVDAQESGTFSLDLTLSKFDEATSISAPPADQVDQSGGGFSFP